MPMEWLHLEIFWRKIERTNQLLYFLKGFTQKGKSSWSHDAEAVVARRCCVKKVLLLTINGQCSPSYRNQPID